MNRQLTSKVGSRFFLIPCLVALAGCTAAVDGGDDPANPSGGSGNGSGNSPGAGATGGSAGTSPAAGGTGAVSSGGGATGGTGTAPQDCSKAPVTAAPIRRLIPFELNNTLKAIGLDSTGLAFNLPSDSIGNGFGNDAAQLGQSYSLIQAVDDLAEAVATNATAAGKLSTLLPCSSGVAAAGEAACARTLVDTYGPKLFRRPLEAGEADSFLTVFQAVRAKSDFPSSVSAVLEAMLQDPAFLYRPEFGTAVADKPNVLRLTGYEAATRLAFLFWGTSPDDALRAVAASGALDTPAGVKTQAAAMLNDERAKGQVRFFFDNLLPIASLSQLERDPTTFPAYSAKLGAAMRQETETFLDYQIFSGPGTWPSVFTADYTFVNETLAKFYGMTGVTGDQFRKVPVDTTKRLGLLSQAGIAAGVIHSNDKNPVTRGAFMVNRMLCQNVPLPPSSLGMIVNPPNDPGKTTREEFSAHSANAVCGACHKNIDPLGFGFENFDAIGQWSDTDTGKPVDASGNSPLIGAFNGPAEMGRRMAESEVAQQCFALNWLSYGYGKTIAARGEDSCTVQTVNDKFKAAGYNVKQLLTALAESDDFLYLPKAAVTE